MGRILFYSSESFGFGFFADLSRMFDLLELVSYNTQDHKVDIANVHDLLNELGIFLNQYKLIYDRLNLSLPCEEGMLWCKIECVWDAFNAMECIMYECRWLMLGYIHTISICGVESLESKIGDCLCNLFKGIESLYEFVLAKTIKRKCIT